MSDAEEEANALGIGGGNDLTTDDEENKTENNETDSTTDGDVLGGVEDAVYPNPDKEVGSMHDIYTRIGVHVPPKVKDAVDDLFIDLRYEYNKQHDTQLEKNWDFYTAIFRVAIKNPELVRDEIGIESTNEEND